MDSSIAPFPWVHCQLAQHDIYILWQQLKITQNTFAGTYDLLVADNNPMNFAPNQQIQQHKWQHLSKIDPISFA